MRIALCLLALPLAASAQGPTTVEGKFVVPADLASFAGRTVEIRLYKFDPRLADASAELVEKLEIKDFAHAQGQETKKAFTMNGLQDG